jgi:hypothetical protein
MPKINSLSKLFSGLSNSASSSTKELAYSQGNSSFVAPCEQSPLARDGGGKLANSSIPIRIIHFRQAWIAGDKLQRRRRMQ